MSERYAVDNVVIKGQPRGIRTLSKKAKSLVLGGIVLVVGIIAFALLATDDVVSKKQDGGEFALMPAAPAGDLESKAREAERLERLERERKAQMDLQAHERPIGKKSDVSDASGNHAGSDTTANKPVVVTMAAPDPDAQARKQKEAVRLQLIEDAMRADVSPEIPTQSVAPAGAQNDPIAGAPRGAGRSNQDALAKGAAGVPPKDSMHAHREHFAESEGAIGGQLAMAKISQLTPVSSDCEIRAGSSIPVIGTRTLSSDVPGMATAMVAETVYDSANGNCVAIPQGSTVKGTYDSDIAVGETRLFVVWQQLTLPDGRTMILNGMGGSDGAGTAGLTGDVNNHYVKIFGSAVMMSLLSAAVQLSQPTSQTNNSTGQPNASQVASGALGQQVGQAGLAVLQRNLSIKPTISIPVGTRFNIDVRENLVFPGSY